MDTGFVAITFGTPAPRVKRTKKSIFTMENITEKNMPYREYVSSIVFESKKNSALLLMMDFEYLKGNY